MGDDQRGSGSPASGIAGLIDRNLEKIAEQSRGLVLLAGIAALAVLGLTAVVDNETARVAGVIGFLLLMFLTVALLYRTTRATSGGDDVARAAGAVNGQWWQLVVNDATPGLTVLDVDLSILPDRSHLAGRKYDPAGREMAAWSSVAVAIKRVEPLEIFYYWEGWYSEAVGTVSGVGVFHFGRQRDDRGVGWFTTGDVEDADFSVTSKVHLERVAAAEREVLRRGGDDADALIARRYADWKARIGTGAPRG